MQRERERITESKKSIKFFILLLIFAAIYPVAVYAQASSIIISTEPLPVRTSPFGKRTSPCKGCSSNHKGQDYRARTPTNVNTNAPVTSCSWVNGYGNLAVVRRTCSNGNTVTEQYAHLSKCPAVGATSVLTGSTGVGTAPHLHYNVLLGGTHVDPVAAIGKDLCNNTVRQQLIEDARQKGIKGGGAGASAPTNPTTPPTGGGSTSGGSGGGGASNPPIVGPYIEEDGYFPPPQRDYIDPGPFPPTTDQFVPTTETDNPVTGCDTAVWNAMVNLSVLQTRREMTVNERFIAKGDSILPYSCFENFYWYAGDVLPILSETRRWENAQIDIIGKVVTVNVFMGEYSLDGAIANAVDAAVETYLVSNFDHEFLGGLLTGELNHAGHEGHDDGEGGGGFLADLFESVFGYEGDEEDEEAEQHTHDANQYGYGCGQMRAVWDMAKCMNADDVQFYKFEDLVSYDPRIYPHNYACSDSGITQGMISYAKNTGIRFDNIVTYFDFIQPTDKECTDPIQTGVTITRRKEGEDKRYTVETSYLDALCITPGCTYQNPKLDGLGKCVKTVLPWELD